MRRVLLLAFVAFASTAALAQSDKDHAAHHPEGASAPAARAVTSIVDPTPAQLDAQMKSMREMRDRMKAAKTTEERRALMAEHMKAMQGGMAMMARKGAPDAKGGTGPQSLEALGKRMDMMEMMMQMMVDREAARAAAGK